MNRKKKKSISEVGTVLHKIKDAAALRPWAEYLAAEEPWKSSGVTADQLIARWTSPDGHWQFFSAADTRTATAPGFDLEHGLIVFNIEGSKPVQLPEAGGFVYLVGAKDGHKSIGKYLLSAAERIISEKYPTVFVLLEGDSTSLERMYKSAGYEEVAKPAEHQTLYCKKLAA